MPLVDTTYLRIRRNELRLEGHERALRSILVDLWPRENSIHSLMNWIDKLPSWCPTSEARIFELSSLISKGIGRNDWWLP